MAGKENLRAYSSEQAREYGSKGGKARAKNSAAKRTMQETWDIIRQMKLSDGDVTDVSDIMSVAEVRDANITVEQAIIFAVAKKAMKGDVKAFEALTKYTASRDKSDKLAAEKAELEVKKLRMEVEAYEHAVERADNAGVVIVDDVSTASEAD